VKSEKVNYIVNPVERKEVKDFIENNHYSGNINGVISDYCFSMTDANGIMVGAALFGRGS